MTPTEAELDALERELDDWTTDPCASGSFRRMCAKSLTAIRSLREGAKWKPIAELRDRKRVMVVDTDGGMFIGEWRADYGKDYTHFRDLPPPPVEPKTEGEA